MYRSLLSLSSFIFIKPIRSTFDPTYTCRIIVHGCLLGHYYLRLGVTFYLCMMGYSQANKMAAEGECTENSIDVCTDVVGNSCNLATKSNKPFIRRDKPLKKVNLTFKRGFIVLKLVKISAVNHLPLDSVLDVKT